MATKPDAQAIRRVTLNLTPTVGKESRRAIDIVIPRRILVFAPHADDELLSCGGTILKYRRWGSEVIVLVASSGTGATPSPKRIAQVEEIRRREFEVSRRELGLSTRSEFLGIQEPLVRRVNVELFTTKIRELRPDLVLLPHPEDRHRIHREASFLALEALFHAPTQVYGGKGHEWLPFGAYFYETLSGTFGNTIPVKSLVIADITDQYAQKLRIIRTAYGTQKRLLKAYMLWINRMAQFRGVTGRCRYGEAFAPETGHVPLKILLA